MTKSERLLLILRILRSQKVTSMEQLCDHFNVSARTIFRDIRSISSIDIPVYNDNGYRLESEEFVNSKSFTADEKVLLRYCLNNNPIVQYTVIRKLLNRIEKKFSDKNQININFKRRIFTPQYSAITENRNSRANKNLKLFLRALSNNNAVTISLKRDKSIEIQYTPHSILLTSKGLVLFVSQRNTIRKKQTIPYR